MDNRKYHLDDNLQTKTQLFITAFSELQILINSITTDELMISNNTIIEIEKISEIIGSIQGAAQELQTGGISAQDFCANARMNLNNIHDKIDNYDAVVLESDPVLTSIFEEIDSIIGAVNTQDPIHQLEDDDLFWSSDERHHNRKMEFYRQSDAIESGHKLKKPKVEYKPEEKKEDGPKSVAKQSIFKKVKSKIKTSIKSHKQRKGVRFAEDEKNDDSHQKKPK